MTNPHAWHVAGVLRGNGARRFHDDRDFVFYVQRYTPENGTRYTGEILTRDFASEADAIAAANALNRRQITNPSSRPAYL